MKFLRSLLLFQSNRLFNSSFVIVIVCLLQKNYQIISFSRHRIDDNLMDRLDNTDNNYRDIDQLDDTQLAWWKMREVTLLRENSRLLHHYQIERAKESAQLQWKQRLREEELDHYYRSQTLNLINEIDRLKANEHHLNSELYHTQEQLIHTNNENDVLKRRIDQLEQVERNLIRLKKRNIAVQQRDQEEEEILNQMKEDVKNKKQGYGVIHHTIALKKKDILKKSPSRYDINGRRIRETDRNKK